ncbi:protein lev-9 [Lingula anatina]|uniref:Protein lev-9 n=1 Tax=Lingula anatina TaxID=7574 RepID=A0A2R2MP69_LINAN|nr:protein lev-9 [Lingula anatina]|eukprot:XP_023932029.1 protein lev-9 [Lingula anatina]
MLEIGAAQTSVHSGDARCSHIKPPSHGYVQIIPYNKFDARARYGCAEGYVLNGPPERICGGDKQWSGEEPYCSKDGFCGPPPPIVNGEPQSSLPKRERRFPPGSQVVYRCHKGYFQDGYPRAMCLGDGKWVMPRMACAPKSCGDPGYVKNGQRKGDIFIYPHRVTFSCDPGYELVGSQYRMCQANGKWSRFVPKCKSIQCQPLSIPENGNMYGYSVAFNSVVRFTCLEGYRLQGPSERKCQENAHWTGTDVKCEEIDCGWPQNLWNGYPDGQHTTYGHTIYFRCYQGMTLQGAVSAQCLDTGNWSEPIPKCWRRCPVPTLDNGTVHGYSPRDKIDHGRVLTLACYEGHALNDTKTKSVCYNGTVSYMPSCIPKNCSTRPGDIKNGIVRYIDMNHGSLARYSCNMGFRIVNDEFMTCLYGRWRGRIPYCAEIVYCPHPGSLQYGRILLVGYIGKYDYRPYVTQIGQGQQIEFQCDRGSMLEGPTRATCIGGMWSPDIKPRCVMDQHPNLPQFPWLPPATIWRKYYRRFRRFAESEDTKGFNLVPWITEDKIPSNLSWKKEDRNNFNSNTISSYLLEKRSDIPKNISLHLLQGKMRIMKNGSIYLEENSSIQLDCTIYKQNKINTEAELYWQTPGGVYTSANLSESLNIKGATDITKVKLSNSISEDGLKPRVKSPGYTLLRLTLKHVQKNNSGIYSCVHQSSTSQMDHMAVTVIVTSSNLDTGQTDLIEEKRRRLFCKIPKLSKHLKIKGSSYRHLYKRYVPTGTTVIFWCKHGRVLRGRTSARCLTTGHWSRQFPVCMTAS